MQPKQQRALDLILAGHSVTDIASQVGVRRETVWRWRNDPSFASEVSVRQAQRRQSIHDELDAGVIESVRMLRGLVADTDAPPGARVRAATALMDRAGLTPSLCGGSATQSRTRPATSHRSLPQHQGWPPTPHPAHKGVLAVAWPSL